MLVVRSRLLVLSAICAAVGFSQEQKEPATVRDYCIKAASGKSMEFEAYVREIAVPMNQVRVDSGEIAWFLFVRGVVPAGTSAKCDYRIVYGYKGLPPESPSTDQIEATLKSAKLNISAKELYAKRDMLTQLVDLSIWYAIDGVGPDAQRGNYIRLNHYSVKPGAMDDWRRLETTYWKPMVETWNKAGGRGSWNVLGLMMPEGDNLPYNAVTLDIFPDWNSLVRGVPFELWRKVHPNTDATDVFDRLDRVRSRHDIEAYKVLEVVRSTTKSSSD